MPCFGGIDTYCYLGSRMSRFLKVKKYTNRGNTVFRASTTKLRASVFSDPKTESSKSRVYNQHSSNRGNIQYYQHPKSTPCRSFSETIQGHKTRLFSVSVQTDESFLHTVFCTVYCRRVSFPVISVRYGKDVVGVQTEAEVFLQSKRRGIERVFEGRESEILTWKSLRRELKGRIYF
jgi:hypothetical protein